MSLPSRPIRVAHVIQNLNFGGMEKVLHNLARSLPGRGFEIHIVVLQYHGTFAEGLSQWATLHQVPPMGKLSLLRPVELAGVLRRITPDIVHSHSGVWLKAVRAARMAGVPSTVHTEHGRPDAISFSDRWLDRRACARTDVLIAVSDALAGTLRRQVARRPEQVEVIINGVDTESLRPDPAPEVRRRRLGLPTSGTIIGSIGRLEPVKNYPLALRAFARLRATSAAACDPRLVLAGDGSQRATLEAMATDLGIAPQVRFLGWRTDAEDLYPAFDLFTLPSLSEGTSISLLEAMSSGVCPVVTDVGGNAAVLGPALSDLLVPSGDEVTLAGRWSELLLDPDSRRRKGLEARERVIGGFSLERMVAQHEALYRRLAAASGSRR
jgi:glycosyltransferase involved in cell wall biosynthesis